MRVFARTLPEQKLRLVNAFKANGEVVAMTGDGVNDAPSLKAAHIGIAMGGRGTDVAREASAMVLLDDDFGSIVRAVRLGRRIYDNLRKAMGFLLAVHVPIAGLSLLPIICGWPLIFTPVHIAFLELVIDPVASIVFEAETEERDVMRKRPRDPKGAAFLPGDHRLEYLSRRMGFPSDGGGVRRGHLAQPPRIGDTGADLRLTGDLQLALDLRQSVFQFLDYRRVPTLERRTLGSAAATAILLALSLCVPSIRALFGFAPMSAADFARVFFAGIATLGLLELIKAIPRSTRFAPG